MREYSRMELFNTPLHDIYPKYSLLDVSTDVVSEISPVRKSRNTNRPVLLGPRLESKQLILIDAPELDATRVCIPSLNVSAPPDISVYDVPSNFTKSRFLLIIITRPFPEDVR